MKETIESRSIWNEAAKAGLLLGLFTGAFILVNTLMPKILPNGKVWAGILAVVINTVLWLVKFAGCLALLRYFMVCFSRKFNVRSVSTLFRFGMLTALTSALIVAGINLLNIRLLSSDDMQAIIDTTLQNMPQVSDSDQIILDRTLSHLPQISFFVTLGYCFLYGTVASKILSNMIAPKDEFGDPADEQ